MRASGILRRLRPAAPDVLVATSRRDRQSSVVLIGLGRRALLVDPGWTPDELDALAADLAALGLTVEGVVATHAHYDHLLWHPSFGAARRWASAPTASADRVAMLDELGPGFAPVTFRTAPPITPVRSRIPWTGPAVHVVVTDAHASGHASLWIPRGRVLVAGDLLSDVEVPLLADDDPLGAAYRRGLDAIEPLAARAALVVPGHGAPGADALDRLHRDRRWLDALDVGRPPVDDPRTATEANREAWSAALAARHAVR
ncbi:MBL fold metallo-hydrolase [Amnibacterium kyonggiense]|uniref:Glyoxylase-like metal-dependent hydrolase (Beta-lactamase superfamily II) n=1 Tax=Amnibacterium kyonggiense TaxID=595671 RepID=A0A4R7FLK5_9MICO|nr:MBL fold metallo-hydrolase [Amnibacterium kyonggiense]TDS77267.1 glyoxylase-like metal-dependent hydrolase (beta-lactamase superfamily II) [Amnibacterium kyonggiense]